MNSQFRSYFMILFQAYMGCLATMRACQISTFHPFTLVVFLAYAYMFLHFSKWDARKEATRIEKITASGLAFLFGTFYLCADYSRLLGGLENKLFQGAILLGCGIGFFCLFYLFTLSFFLAAKKFRLCEEMTTDIESADIESTDIESTDIESAGTESPSAKNATQNRSVNAFLYHHLPLFTFLCCLIGWLPYLLNNFPGVMTVDSLNQYGQIIHALPFSNHHPWVHTQLIRLFYHSGMLLTGSEIVGLGLFTIFQMLVMAGIFSYLAATMYQLRVKPFICYLTIAFYAVLPYNAIYMITMWKDILFSGMVLLFSTVLFRFLYFPKLQKEISPLTWVLYFISGFCVCLFRSNGFYAFVLTLPFLLLLFRKDWKKHVSINLLLLAVVVAIKIPVMNAFAVSQPDFVESLSIPLQMAARVYVDGETIFAQDDAVWAQVVDTTQISEVYEDFCSDHMKNLVRFGNPQYLEEHKGELLIHWFSFGLRHPLSYFRGYVDATKGYWFPDVPNIIGSDERIAENPYNLKASPIIYNSVTIKIKEILFKLPDMLPLYGLLFSIGMMTWFALLLAGNTFLQKEKAGLFVFLPNAAILATLMVATPVNKEFRYAYSLLLTLPLFVCVAFFRSDHFKPKQNQETSQTK